MKMIRLVSFSLLVAAVAAAGCEFKRGSSASVLQPTTASSSQPLVGTWASQAVTATSSSPACVNFVWTVASQTATSIDGTFSALCLGTIGISGTASGRISGSTLTVIVTGTGNVPGTPNCSFALTGTGTIEGDLIRIPYTGNTCLGPVSGTETLRRSDVQPTPPPAPAPAPTPAPTPTPTPPPSTGPDQINMSQATILNSPLDLASWPITSTVSRLELRSTGVHIEFSKQDGPGRWPDVTPPGWSGSLQYTLGMCLNINSRWYCSAVVEFWYGLAEAGGPPQDYATNWFYDPIRWAPMTGHQPVPGETVGFFACAGDCRNNTRGDLSPVRERTNVVLVPMPGNGGAGYTFSVR